MFEAVVLADGVEFVVILEKKGGDRRPGDMDERAGEGRGTSLGDSKEACRFMCERWFGGT